MHPRTAAAAAHVSAGFRRGSYRGGGGGAAREAAGEEIGLVLKELLGV